MSDNEPSTASGNDSDWVPDYLDESLPGETAEFDDDEDDELPTGDDVEDEATSEEAGQ